MKYTLEMEINLPCDKVIELFDDPAIMSKWQPGLISFEHLEGEAGKPGAKSKLKYKMGKREIEMIETVLVRNLPDEFTGSYEADGVWNVVKNQFVAKGDKTLWIVDNEFRMKGFYKIMGWLFPGMFRKETLKFMGHFKQFAETGEPVSQ